MKNDLQKVFTYMQLRQSFTAVSAYMDLLIRLMYSTGNMQANSAVVKNGSLFVYNQAK